MNNEPDYKDNLVLKSDMTYKDVFKFAQSSCGWDGDDEYIVKQFTDKWGEKAFIHLYDDGEIHINHSHFVTVEPSKMKLIIEGLM